MSEWCKICKYNDADNGCIFYVMGTGNEEDKPCRKNEDLVQKAANDFLQAFLSKDMEGEEE